MRSSSSVSGRRRFHHSVTTCDQPRGPAPCNGRLKRCARHSDCRPPTPPPSAAGVVTPRRGTTKKLTLEAEVALTLGALDLDVKLQVTDAVLAVVGPNGAGKSTLLRALAGLVRIERGRVVIDGQVVDDPVANVHPPPQDRHVGMVFQDHLLFANLNVLENVAFGLRARHVPRGEARRRAAEWLEARWAARRGRRPPPPALRRPGRTGGPGPGPGHRTGPAPPRRTPRRGPHRGPSRAAPAPSPRAAPLPRTRLLVTHDPIEAAALADELLVVEDGHVSQQGPLAEVTAHPRSAWVATMVGLNLLTGVAHGTTVLLPEGQTLVIPTATSGAVFAAFRPNAVTLHRSRPEGSARNVWPGQATELHPAGDRARIRVDGPVPLVAEVTAAAVNELHIAEGGQIWAAVKSTEIDVYAA